MAAPILIIGAGLSGLVAAYRLHQQGREVRILEARDRAGGRIQTLRGKRDTPMELGATWIHPPHLRLRSLVDELGLELFPQYMAGAALYQAAMNHPPQTFEMPGDEPFFRVVGGTQRITDALLERLPEGCVHYGARVSELRTGADGDVELQLSGGDHVLKASQVVVTLPPQRWAGDVRFSPPLSDALIEVATATHTWMADSMKCAVEYERPWWRERGLSGALFSQQGPLIEFMDQCDFENQKFALCGFVNRGLIDGLEREQQIALIDAQLKQAFGSDALDYVGIELKAWQGELGVNEGLVPHQFNGHPELQRGYWGGRLYFAGTETAHPHGGFMEGAVIAAERVVAELVFDS
ncbi:flavin monoamine oxidase family protein [Sulfuriroseicoccus oceanibius]|uniref:FAD-dependent oxidoreductase n=1 Tax=Sulfuriroseicoccus oceanibius TaxID=2707525 RepID=A0A6B3LDW7_9BACT|nr:FAD-dependent oxidoreductase [Sulfuriroseicoccus oceanibius]QQL45922.1 FAD-dependent oxidoreductase [Sulfuriroseicoccus oceanibius]